MIGMHPTTDRTADVAGLADDDLDHPTASGSVRQVVHHLLAASEAFRDAAAKSAGASTDRPPAPTDDALPDGWRDLVRTRLTELADAWDEPAAWEGMTRAGGIDLPGEVCGLVALDEVLLHGWDLAARPERRTSPATRSATPCCPSSARRSRCPTGPTALVCSVRWSRCPTTRRASSACWASPAATRGP